MNELYIQCIGKDNTLKKLRLNKTKDEYFTHMIMHHMLMTTTSYFQQYYRHANGTTTFSRAVISFSLTVLAIGLVGCKGGGWTHSSTPSLLLSPRPLST